MDLDLKLKALPMPAVIKAIQNHPTIWNVHSEDYRNKTMKEAAWLAICHEFVPGWNELPEHLKSAYGREIKKKWHHVRDYYKRGISSKSGKRKYVYWNIMAFMKPVFLNKKNQKDGDEMSDNTLEDYEYLENLTDDEETTEVVVKHELGDPIETTASEEPSENIQTINMKSRFEDIPVESSVEKLPGIEDEDLTFFRCLLPDIKKLNAAQKFDFKLETMQLLKKYKNFKRMRDSDSD